MSTELCKYYGGTCNGCMGMDVCMARNPVDVEVAEKFLITKRIILRDPTCIDFEPNFLRAFNAVREVRRDEINHYWHGLSEKGDRILRIHPNIMIDPSDWYGDHCEPVSSLVLEKNPYWLRQEDLKLGSRNGITNFYGMPFALCRKVDGTFVATRPVVMRDREKLLNYLLDFESRFGTIVRSH